MEYLRYYTVTTVRNMHLMSLRSLQSPMDSDTRLAVRSTPKAMDLQSVWYKLLNIYSVDQMILNSLSSHTEQHHCNLSPAQLLMGTLFPKLLLT